MERSLYDVLQVDPAATPDEIQRAYWRRARLTHPDAGGSDLGMQEVNRAWEVLGDPVRRRRYDREREGEPAVDPPVDDAYDDRPIAPALGRLSVLAVVPVAVFAAAVVAFAVAVVFSSRPLLGASAALVILASVMMVALPFVQMTRSRRR